MAHWAEIDENNIVTRVLVTYNDDPEGDEGYKWLIDNFGGTWIQASYNTVYGIHLQGGTPVRKNYPNPGFTYYKDIDAFVAPKPEEFPSWVLNEDKGVWEPPIPYPGPLSENPLIIRLEYLWDEKTLSWIKTGEGNIDE
jgi:hypothetical protein